MKAKEKAIELVEQFSPHITVWDCYWDAPRNEDDIIKDAIKCAIISIENEYNALREQLFNFKACGILTNEKVYLFRLNELIEEEKQVKQELEKM